MSTRTHNICPEIPPDVGVSLSGVGAHEYEFVGFCGAYVCFNCDDHRGLARCYCGWSAGGGDGYNELIEMGENIEDFD